MQPWTGGTSWGRRRRLIQLQPQHLGLEDGAVAPERLRRHVEVEPDGEQEVHLQVVHLRQADAADPGEVGVVVAPARGSAWPSGSKLVPEFRNQA